MCLGAGNERRTAELAAQLEAIYREKGESQRAERFADLHRRYSRAAGKAGEAAAPAGEKAPPEFEIPAAELQVPAAAPAPEPQTMQEVDLSEDWAAMVGETTSPPAEQAPPPEAVREQEPAEAAQEPPAAREFKIEVEPELAPEEAAAPAPPP